MALLKFLFTALLFYYLGKMLWRALLGAISPNPPSQREAEPGENEQSRLVIGEMVPCVRCGTYVAKSQAVSQSGKIYCSETCKEQL